MSEVCVCICIQMQDERSCFEGQKHLTFGKTDCIRRKAFIDLWKKIKGIVSPRKVILQGINHFDLLSHVQILRMLLTKAKD